MVLWAEEVIEFFREASPFKALDHVWSYGGN